MEFASIEKREPIMATKNESLLERLLQKAAELDASDLHLVAGEPPIYRVKGSLQRAEQDPLSADEIQHIVEAEIGSEQAARIGRELGHAIAMCQVPGVVQGRMCVTRAAGALTATTRILPARLPDPARARIPQALLDAACSPNGLIVVAGETGSGKTTVAMMLLDHINASSPVRILTIEDPVGVRLEPKRAVITQQNTDSDTPSYASALRAALRQDPDVLFVGETRDLGTLEACITLVDTGHLVITQIHAASPEDVIQRMIDVHPEETRPIFRRRLASGLRAVSVQKLLPRAGKPGVTAAYGLLIVDKEMRRAIADGRDIKDRTAPLPEGCQTLADDIRRLQAEGLITEQTADDALSLIE